MSARISYRVGSENVTVSPERVQQLADRRSQAAAKLGPTPTQLRESDFTLVPETKHSGTTFKYRVKDGDVNASFKPFMVPDANLAGRLLGQGKGAVPFIREETAARVRTLAGDPTVGRALSRLKLSDDDTILGYVKAKIPDAKDLKAKVDSWLGKPGIVDSILSEAVWSYALGNHDMKAEQFKRIDLGDGQEYAIQADEDQTGGFTPQIEPIARDNKLGGALKKTVPAQNLLYNRYVHDKLDLDFSAMFDTAARIQAVPDDTYRNAFRPLAEALEKDGELKATGFTSVEQYLDVAVARKNNITQAFQTLVDGMVAERGHTPTTLSARVKAMPKDMRDRRLEKVADRASSAWFTGLDGLARHVTQAAERQVRVTDPTAEEQEAAASAAEAAADAAAPSSA